MEKHLNYRIFQGRETKQIEAPGGYPVIPDAWYYEPEDYEGDSVWSEPHVSRIMAILGLSEELLDQA